MSIEVERDELGDALRVYRSAYLITVGDHTRAHVVAAAPSWDGELLTVADLGRRSLANLAVNPELTLLWPAPEPGGHSLIVDGEMVADATDPAGSVIRVALRRAVLHRPAANPSGPVETGCAADCVEIPTGS